ncbi:MAG TPA: carboxypeptidase-like regulatory domain-containing protein [Chloroflexota bacterium]|jgi:hypothetical protein|nr:carboxypeptidase-like regulatory domain-containing protein [Chloroflexota bacterium]
MPTRTTSDRFIARILALILVAALAAPAGAASAAPAAQTGAVGSVAGAVLDADGRPLANAIVTIDVHSGFPWLAETDANGRFRLDGVGVTRSIELKAYRPGYLYGDTGIAVTAGGLTTKDSKLPLQPSGAPAPVLTDPRIEPATAAPGDTVTLSATVVDPDKDLAPEWLIAGSPRFGRGVNLKPIGADRYQARFAVPADAAPGTYGFVFFAADDACNVNGSPTQPFPTLPLTVRAPGAAAGAPDFAVPNGWFYTQTGGGGGRGYAVTDEGGLRFWSEFRRLGGVQAVGYPASQRFQWDGFTVQVFQRVVFQWRPESGSVAFVNVFDRLHDLGKDEFLLRARQTPPPRAFPDAGQPWERVVQNHLAVLEPFPAIRAAYFGAVGDPIQANGLPVSDVTDMGNHLALRAQRVVFQQWKEDVPWAKQGQVTVALGGDIAKELGVLPDPAALQPVAPPR